MMSCAIIFSRGIQILAQLQPPQRTVEGRVNVPALMNIRVASPASGPEGRGFVIAAQQALLALAIVEGINLLEVKLAGNGRRFSIQRDFRPVDVQRLAARGLPTLACLNDGIRRAFPPV
ncbi:Uncharacterised protein [Cedecea neteri]|uniref:Uncharacterized protein n=1 Tax=Cedecea neteri TaxID=158822 RepID=A0A2X2T0Z9_9ENTR|nr:Uncharacterised protein [Cedecea neteri]